jgi:hypothetical protein
MTGTPTLVITTPDVNPPAGQYRYQEYDWQSATEPPPPSTAQFWRWLAYRDSPAAVDRQAIRLYVAALGTN